MVSQPNNDMEKNNNGKVTPDRPIDGDCQFNLDGILSELGSFGKYQLLLLFLLAFRDAFLAMCNFHYVFTAPDVAYRCEIPECDAFDARFNATWTSYALLNETRSCHRPAPLPAPLAALLNAPLAAPPIAPPAAELPACRAADFDHSRPLPCERIVYEDYNSIVAEFDLGCEPWKRTLIGTVHNLGLVFSFVMSGFISDRYGRKVIIVWSPLAVGVVGLIKSFAGSYWMLLMIEFLETAIGYGNASMVLSLESVSHKRRVIFSCMSDMLASFGSAFFGLIAWRIPYWRYMMRAIYAPLLVAVFYIFLVDEGVRWLLAHNKRDEAVRVLNKVAKINNITLSTKAKEMLDKIAEQKDQSNKDSRDGTERPALLSVLRSRTIIWRVLLMAACFFCVTFVYSSAVINSTAISGNKYLNYSALQLISIPTRLITALALTRSKNSIHENSQKEEATACSEPIRISGEEQARNSRFGRKAPICVAYTLCAIFFVTSAFFSNSLWWTSVLFYLAGKMCSSFGNFSVHVVAMEVFPTTSRNMLTNIANTVGRLGSVLAPQTPLLEKYMRGLPTIVFGGVALGPAFLALFLPDTSKSALPDDVHQAEHLDELEDNEEPFEEDFQEKC